MEKAKAVIVRLTCIGKDDVFSLITKKFCHGDEWDSGDHSSPTGIDFHQKLVRSKETQEPVRV